jgi:hypothetical protein
MKSFLEKLFYMIEEGQRGKNTCPKNKRSKTTKTSLDAIRL